MRILSDLTDGPWTAAGHAEVGEGGSVSHCGPPTDAAGQACGPAVEPDPWAQPRQRVRELLARAERLKAALVSGRGLTAKVLAEREGVAQARISQLLGLLRLPPSVLADLTDPQRTGPVPTVKQLEQLSRTKNAVAAVASYRKVCRANPATDGGPSVPRQRGFQHLLARARRYKAMLDSGEHRSLSSIARVEGISHHRVADVLDLLALAPEVLERVDVPAGEVPAGLTQKELLRIARLKRAQQASALSALTTRA